jgi:hypothetical protein
LSVKKQKFWQVFFIVLRWLRFALNSSMFPSQNPFEWLAAIFSPEYPINERCRQDYQLSNFAKEKIPADSQVPQRHDQSTGMENKAKLVLAKH